MTNLLDTLEAVRIDPLSFLDCECALSLGTFLFGYKAVDASAGSVLCDLARRIPGPDAADSCTRAYLAYGGGSSAFWRVLSELRAIVDSEPPVPFPGIDAAKSFMEVVREPIGSGRSGVVLAEPTVVCLANYYRGFLAGMNSVAPTSANEAAEALARFERWLRKRYSEPRASWYGIIRVFEGIGMDGLRRFVALWDEFEASS